MNREPTQAQSAREHLRLLTEEVSDKTGDVRIANARVRALINIGLELASERDPDRMLRNVCVAARDLFGATYVTLGILDPQDRTVARHLTWGTDAAGWIEAGDPVAGILEAVVVGRRTVRGLNAGGDPAGPRLPLRHPEVQAYLAGPIASPSQVYGWICFVGNDGRAFTESDEDLVAALSGQIGRIYEGSHVALVSQKRAEELEHEILERKQAESNASHERDRAQRHLDAAEIFLVALDTEGRITLVNRCASAVLGWTVDELLGRDWFEACIPESHRQMARTAFANALRGDPSIIENPILSRSGDQRSTEWRHTIMRDAVGRIVGTFSSGTDISGRDRTAEATRVAEERMRFAMDSAGVGIWDMDYKTGVLQWSETLEAQYGLQPGTFAGTFEAFVDRIHPDDRSAVIAAMGKAAAAGTDFSIQHRTTIPGGLVRWLSGTGRVHLDGEGQPSRGVGISQDVTERRTLEEQYQQAQKMEAIGRLAGGVAHDFNNLLTVILGYCELLLTDLDQDTLRQGAIKEIQSAGTRAAGLTRQLLAFSRKQIIELKLLDVNAVITDMRVMLARLILEDVRVVMSRSLQPACVLADRGQVEQIVMNLAVSAQDAMPKGGTLTIETANVELDEEYARMHAGVNPGPHVVLTVTDTGTGMTPQVMARLFEPFFTTKGPGLGTGLGLATVHSIVMRSGGSVNVYSELGRGTSFKVYFPSVKGAEGALEAALAAAAPVRGAASETVLVVEDADGLRELTRKLLLRLGYTVLVAANAQDALLLFEENTAIAVVLTDVVMPGASGPELIGQLTEKRPGTKIVYMSGYTEEAIVNHGVILPGIAFLHKPFTSDALGRKIREVLDGPQGRVTTVASR